MTNSEARTIYGFDHQTKIEALERSGYQCEQCGAEDSRTNKLEIDHIVAIFFARETNCLSVEVIKSIANSQVLCHKCHFEKHSMENRMMYQELAPVVLSKYLAIVVDHHKDDWREKLARVPVGHD